MMHITRTETMSELSKAREIDKEKSASNPSCCTGSGLERTAALLTCIQGDHANTRTGEETSHSPTHPVPSYPQHLFRRN